MICIWIIANMCIHMCAYYRLGGSGIGMWIWCNMFMLEPWVDRVGYIVTYICIHLYIFRGLAAPSIYVYIIYTFFYIYLTFTHPGLINWGRSSAPCHFGLKEGRSHPGNLRKVPTQPALWRKLQGGLISRHPTCSRNFSVVSGCTAIWDGVFD